MPINGSEKTMYDMTTPPQVPSGRHSSLVWTIVVDHRGFSKRLRVRSL